ncbi:dolichyl-diphosphooligosaccharide--protein glycosyltransferase subunit 2 [Manduca sexta]|uniref:dolichyl-diphosphooligosaccharide--protein glycosyltransferase subunit 2 n=1 Tax=Manduca sexta TaxID=7130 RepID=UPI00188DCE09|nr:dolichyl-diphosphooligosaccharide--protein glycosyltransferase subunit 2 [Manduca sexta]
MNSYGLFILLLSLIAFSNANTLQGTLDLKRLQSILEESLKSKDIAALHYAVKGLKLLNLPVPDLCAEVGAYKYDVKNVEQIFHLTSLSALTSCQNSLTPDILIGPTQTLDKNDATLAEIYYAVYALKALGKGSIMDREDALKNLIQLLKKDDSPANYGYVFALCEHMGCAAWTAAHAEGLLLAADETDSKALHFDGGLPTTSLLLTTITRSYKMLKKPTPLSEEQRYKFAEYLLSRRSVNSAKGAALLLDAALALADDEPTPISIAIKGKKYITSESDSIEFAITDLIGRALKNLKPEEVVAQSGTRLADDVVVLSKQPLSQKANEPTTFVLNLNKIKAQYGLYKIALSAGAKTTNVNVAVLGEIQVGSVEVGIGDVDGTTSPKITTVTYPNKLSEVLQADHLQKVSLKFSVRDKYNKPVLVQQAFVRVGSAQAPDHETIFVAEPDNTKAYKVELNVGSIAKHLNHMSGSYSLTMYLGDSAVSNPIAWPVGDVQFNFGKDANALGEVLSKPRKSYSGALPEISHVFRSPEARPARLVSDVFACACAAPLLLLLVLWARLRINFAHFPFTPSALIFHLALGGSLGLYAVLWLQLSMFEAMRYLLPLALITFLSGHRLLRRLVQDKTAAR